MQTRGMSVPGQISYPSLLRFFVAWLLVGAALVSGLVSILSIGPVLLLLGGIGGAVLAVRRRTGREMAGVVSGLGLPLLYLAILNRSGPGVVCTTTAMGRYCQEQWSPWPWVVCGVLLMFAGAFLFARLSASHSITGPREPKLGLTPGADGRQDSAS